MHKDAKFQKKEFARRVYSVLFSQDLLQVGRRTARASSGPEDLPGVGDLLVSF
jgi:hypothetical protein